MWNDTSSSGYSYTSSSWMVTANVAYDCLSPKTSSPLVMLKSTFAVAVLNTVSNSTVMLPDGCARFVRDTVMVAVVGDPSRPSVWL